MQDGSRAYCITDAIHSKKIEFLLDELDQKKRPLGPVKLSRGSGTEYRIDLEAVNRGFWPKTQESKPEVKSERIRAQFEIEEHKLEALKRLAAAERYDSYTDWLRAVVDRALLNGGVR